MHVAQVPVHRGGGVHLGVEVGRRGHQEMDAIVVQVIHARCVVAYDLLHSAADVHAGTAIGNSLRPSGSDVLQLGEVEPLLSTGGHLHRDAALPDQTMDLFHRRAQISRRLSRGKILPGAIVGTASLCPVLHAAELGSPPLLRLCDPGRLYARRVLIHNRPARS